MTGSNRAKATTATQRDFLGLLRWRRSYMLATITKNRLDETNQGMVSSVFVSVAEPRFLVRLMCPPFSVLVCESGGVAS